MFINPMHIPWSKMNTCPAHYLAGVPNLLPDCDAHGNLKCMGDDLFPHMLPHCWSILDDQQGWRQSSKERCREALV